VEGRAYEETWSAQLLATKTSNQEAGIRFTEQHVLVLVPIVLFYVPVLVCLYLP